MIQQLIAKKRKKTREFEQCVSILHAYKNSIRVDIPFIESIENQILSIYDQLSNYEKLLVDAYYTNISINKDLMRLNYSINMEVGLIQNP